MKQSLHMDFLTAHRYFRASNAFRRSKQYVGYAHICLYPYLDTLPHDVTDDVIRRFNNTPKAPRGRKKEAEYALSAFTGRIYPRFYSETLRTVTRESFKTILPDPKHIVATIYNDLK